MAIFRGGQGGRACDNLTDEINDGVGTGAKRTDDLKLVCDVGGLEKVDRYRADELALEMTAFADDVAWEEDVVE